MPIMHVKVDQKVIDEICRYCQFYNETPDKVVNEGLKFLFDHIDQVYMGDQRIMNG